MPPKPPHGGHEVTTAPANGTAIAPASGTATTPTRPRQWLWRALVVLLLIAAHEALVRLVAQGDLLARLVADRSVLWLLATALLYGVRLVVLFALPGWLLWLATATTVRQLRQNDHDG